MAVFFPSTVRVEEGLREARVWQEWRVAKSAGSSYRSQVNQGIILPLILGVAAIIGILHSGIFASARWVGGPLDWIRDHMVEVDRAILDRFHAQGRKTPPRDDIVVLAVDDASLTCSDAWDEDFAQSPTLKAMRDNRLPWPRKIWADTIDRILNAGAKAIFLDLAFTSPTDEANDRALRECLERHKGRVVIGANFNTNTIRGLENSSLDYPSTTVVPKTPPEDGTWGFLDYLADDDNVIRHAHYQLLRSTVEQGVPDPDEKPIPSITLTLARKVDPKANTAVNHFERLRYCRPDAYTPLSIHQIFIQPLWQQNFGNGAFFKDKIVLVGVTVQQEQDYKSTPVGVIAGVLVHATSVTDLLSHSFVKDAPGWVLWASIFAGAAIAWLLISYVGHPIMGLLTMWIVSALAVVVCYKLFNKANMEVSPFAFNLVLNASGVLGLATNFFLQRQETKKLSGYINRYHSPDRVQQLLKDREGLFQTLGGVRRTVTILFSDVRSFTSMSEGMEPEDMVSQLNEYLSGMVEQVYVHDGGIDKFVGDAVMATWGTDRRVAKDGSNSQRDAEQAVASGLAMRARLALLNKDWIARGKPEFKIGIGIHQGAVVVCNVGSAPPYERMELTVIGDNVNLTSRLEGLSKDYHCDLIISEAVHGYMKSTHLCRPLGETKVKGKEKGVKIYFVEGLREGREDPAWFPLYAQAMEAGFLEPRNIPKARELLEQCKTQAPEDRMVDYFLGKWAGK